MLYRAKIGSSYRASQPQETGLLKLYRSHVPLQKNNFNKIIRNPNKTEKKIAIQPETKHIIFRCFPTEYGMY
jgi:hypothetical protein